MPYLRAEKDVVDSGAEDLEIHVGTMVPGLVSQLLLPSVPVSSLISLAR